ncbi:hypothetical protein [Okeania sp. SIO1I7]|uniref:hypothetical protein n=1 Tax=Okeania sp. SIO1I7 TaxID=2607772 RepID=UPI0013FA1F34|nr:hypothetical protein [Okeania sp. SIO1I7]NET29512.1 hypothetical protein [Okeania sp. SIO1I7]
MVKPRIYPESIKGKASLALSPVVRKYIKERSKKEKISMSEIVEGWAREEMNLGPNMSMESNLNKQQCLSALKKLASRLELTNKQLDLLENNYFKKIDEHRDRLILRLEENRKFTAEFKSEAEDLRKELQELESTSEVLGALIEQLTED